MNSVSVITVVLNDKNQIEKTIKSIIGQNYPNLEYIIIDGGSTDGTLDVINKYKDNITLSISENDTGIYNAMNKGIKLSKGDYIMFINSGDFLVNNCVIETVFNINRKEDFIIGEIKQLVGNRVLKTNTPKKLSFYTFFTGTVYHQATFTKRLVFEELGGYNEKNRITSDWEFVTLAVCKYSKSYLVINEIFSQVDAHGVSAVYPDIIQNERNQLLEKHFKAFIPDYELLRKYKKLSPQNAIKELYRFYRKLIVR